jgi:signal transduction histidine kinase
MHDVVTHRVSLMVLQAGALRMTAPDEPTRRAAEELRAAGSKALDELRDLVGILRAGPDGEVEPQRAQPQSPGLETLVAESTAVGVPTELLVDGDPGLASPVVARTAYRTVQEALTNVRKHAPGARATVRVRYQSDQVRVEVDNTPPTRPADAVLARSGSGLGIASLRQRIELLGGSLRAAPTPGGGFRVEAVLPAYVPTASPAPGPARPAPSATGGER